MAYICIREAGTGKVLCRLDPIRCIIEVQRRGRRTYVDLTTFGLRFGSGEQDTPDGASAESVQNATSRAQ